VTVREKQVAEFVLNRKQTKELQLYLGLQLPRLKRESK
jgi:hypothetical protein